MGFLALALAVVVVGFTMVKPEPSSRLGAGAGRRRRRPGRWRRGPSSPVRWPVAVVVAVVLAAVIVAVPEWPRARTPGAGHPPFPMRVYPLSWGKDPPPPCLPPSAWRSRMSARVAFISWGSFPSGAVSASGAFVATP